MSAADLLKGKPLGMPLHCALVHFPIALFTLSMLLDVGAYVGGGAALVRGAFYALGIGLIMSAIAAVPGLVDYSAIRSDHPGRVTAKWHLALNVAAMIAYASSLALRWGRLDVSPTAPAPFSLSIAGILIIAVSGYLGGALVYGDGIGVGRHRRAHLPKGTLRVSAAEDSSGFAPVTEEGELTEGNTLRIDLEGTVMTLVRLHGEVCAFQEFCTHRHGPLSEGCFANGEVQCPWHNSRFNVKSGKVSRGPAKMNLKVFATRISEGRIWVQPRSAGETITTQRPKPSPKPPSEPLPEPIPQPVPEPVPDPDPQPAPPPGAPVKS